SRGRRVVVDLVRALAVGGAPPGGRGRSGDGARDAHGDDRRGHSRGCCRAPTPRSCGSRRTPGPRRSPKRPPMASRRRSAPPAPPGRPGVAGGGAPAGETAGRRPRDGAGAVPAGSRHTGATAGTRERPPQWNVVLVSLDTLRSDRLGVYGAHRATSPTLDA